MNFVEVLGPELVHGPKLRGVPTGDALRDKLLVGLYFGGEWCPYCPPFSRELADTYRALAGQGFEVVYAGSEPDQASWQRYFGTMPWKAVPFATRQAVRARYPHPFSGIPTMHVFTGDGELVTEEGRSLPLAALQSALAKLRNGEKPQLMFGRPGGDACAGCDQPIKGGAAVSVMNKTWHADCFKCGNCHQPIREALRLDPDGNPVHVQCPKPPGAADPDPSCGPAESAAEDHPRCAECEQPITSGGRIQALGKFWHAACFRCTKCGQPIKEPPFTGYNGKPMHMHCRPASRRSRGSNAAAADGAGAGDADACADCGRPTGVGTTITALGKRWHSDCFKCAKCRRLIAEDTFSTQNGRVVHVACPPTDEGDPGAAPGHGGLAPDAPGAGRRPLSSSSGNPNKRPLRPETMALATGKGDDLVEMMEELKLSQVAEKLIQNGVDSLMGLRLLDVQDLVSLGIMPLQAKIIMTRCHELSGKDKDFHGPEPAVPDADAGDARDGRRRRRRENPTFMTAPGTNFMTLIEEAGGSVEAVIDKLKAYAADAAKAKLCIKEFQEELERYKTDPQGTTKALLWLYSLDCWVYQDCNRACREDKKSLLEYFMPFIKAVLQGIPKASDLHVGTSDAGATLYRRTKLTADQQSKYSEGTKFIWTGFTSTSLEDTNPEFGPHLFVISIPHKFLSKLPKLDSVSAFPEEHEVLLPCNIGLAVTSTGPSTRPGTTLEVALKVQYEINCIW